MIKKTAKKSKEKEQISYYNTSSFSFSLRAKEQLMRYDEGNTKSLFYATLELRMGIESRLIEYYNASYEAKSTFEGVETPKKQNKKYRPKEILQILYDINPKTHQLYNSGFLITFSNESFEPTYLKYTPVTEKFRKFYGVLNNILHYTYFDNNKHWRSNRKIWKEDIPQSLPAYREFLEEVLAELEKVNEGNLSTPLFILE